MSNETIKLLNKVVAEAKVDLNRKWAMEKVYKKYVDTIRQPTWVIIDRYATAKHFAPLDLTRGVGQKYVLDGKQYIDVCYDYRFPKEEAHKRIRTASPKHRNLIRRLEKRIRELNLRLRETIKEAYVQGKAITPKELDKYLEMKERIRKEYGV
jgi:hypothetical protein